MTGSPKRLNKRLLRTHTQNAFDGQVYFNFNTIQFLLV